MKKIILTLLLIVSVASGSFYGDWLSTTKLEHDYNNDGRVNLKDLPGYQKQNMAYDNSNVDITAGGYGYSVDNGSASFGDDKTVASPEAPFGCTGTMTGFSCRMYTTDGAAVSAGTVKIKILSGGSSPYTLEETEDITSQVNTAIAAQTPGSAGRFNLVITGLSIPVAAGEFISLYNASTTRPVRNLTDIGFTTYYGTGDTETLPTSVTNQNWLWEATISSNQYIALKDETGYGVGAAVHVPAWVDQPFYYSIEDIDVPDTEQLSIILSYTDITGGGTGGEDVVEKTLTINFDGGANDTKISLDGDATSKLLTGQEGEKINAYIWIDPVNDEISVTFVNTETGQGWTGNVADDRFISLQDRDTDALTADISIKRISLTQSAGTAATVGDIVTNRMPVIVFGDSIGNSILSTIGAAFTEERYVIDAALSGNRLLDGTDTAGTTPSKSRWNGGHQSFDANTQQDIVGMRDVIVILVNAMCVNDVLNHITAASTSTEILSVASRCHGALQVIAGDCQSDAMYFAPENVGKAVTDVILCEMIPYEANAGAERTNEQSCQTKINTYLGYTSFKLQVPIAKVWDGYVSGGYGYSGGDGTHPDASGTAYIVAQIATAYETPVLDTGPDFPDVAKVHTSDTVDDVQGTLTFPNGDYVLDDLGTLFGFGGISQTPIGTSPAASDVRTGSGAYGVAGIQKTPSYDPVNANINVNDTQVGLE